MKKMKITKKVCGWGILIASIVIVLTFWTEKSTFMKIMMLILGIEGIHDGIRLIKEDKKSDISCTTN